MQPYYPTPAVAEAFTDQNGNRHEVVKTRQLETFKMGIESYISQLTAEVNTLRGHANWIEPRLNDYHKFMEWMQRVHPDVITAYTQATKVEKIIDKANDEYVYPQAEASA